MLGSFTSCWLPGQLSNYRDGGRSNIVLEGAGVSVLLVAVLRLACCAKSAHYVCT